MGLLDFLKKAKDWVVQNVVQPVGSAIQGAANWVGQNVIHPAAQFVQQHLPAAAQAALPPAAPILAASQLFQGAAGEAPKVASAVGGAGSQVLSGINQAVQAANPINLPQKAQNVFLSKPVQSVPLLNAITKPAGELIKSGTAPLEATGKLLSGDVAGAQTAVQQSPLLQRAQQVQSQGGGPVKQFLPAVGLGAEVGSTVAPVAGAGLGLAGRAALGGAAGALFQGGQELHQGEKFNPVDIGTAAATGGVLNVAIPPVAKAAAGAIKKLFQPTAQATEKVVGPTVNITSMNQVGDRVANPAELRSAANQIRESGSVQIVPTETVTSTQTPALSRGAAKLAGQTPEPPTVQVNKGIRVVPSESPRPVEPTLPPPEPSVKVNETPQGPPREYGRSQSLRGSEKVPEPVKEELGQTYSQRPSLELAQQAYSELKQNPVAEQQFRNTIEESVQKKEFSDPSVSDKVAALTQHYIDKGDDASLKAAADLTKNTQDLYTKAGQFNQAAANFDRLGSAGTVRYAERLASDNNIEFKPEFRKYIAQKAEALSKMPEGADKNFARFMLQRDIANELPMGVREKLVSFWKAGLLTNPATSAGNIMGNVGSAAGETSADLFASALDAPLSLVTGQRSKAFTFRGKFGGAGEGVGKGWQYLKTGYDERHLANKYDAPKVINNGMGPVGKLLDYYENGVYRLMGGEDFPFYYSRKANSLYDQAKVAVKNGNLEKGQIEDFVKDPTKFAGGEQALKNAVSDASYAVFQNDTTIGHFAQTLADKSPLLGNLFAPFRRTPSAVAMRLVDYSPVGAARGIVKAARSATKEKGLTQQAQRELVQELGRAGTGTGLMYAGTELYKKGVMTLNYPKDQKEQQLWELEGKQPYSIKVDGKWRSLNYASPWGQLLMTGGFFQKGKDETGSFFGGFATAVPGALKTLTDQTFLKGLSGALGAINYPEQFGPRFLEQTAGSVVPSIVRNVAIGLDPVGGREIKDATSFQNTILNSITQNIPGLRENLPPRQNVFGEPMPKPRNFAEQLFDPTRPSQVIDNPINQQLEQLKQQGQLYLPEDLTAKQKIAGKEVTLNPQELSQLKSISGGLLKSEWERTMSQESYQQASPEIKKAALNAASDDARAVGRVVAVQPLNKGTVQDFIKSYSDLSTRQRNMIIGVEPDYVAEVTQNAQEKQFKEQNQPDISPDLQRKLNAYFGLPTGTGQKTAFLSANPDLKEYFDKNTAFKNAYAAKFGEDIYGKKVAAGTSAGRRGFGKRGFARRGSRFAGGRKVRIARTSKVTSGSRSRSSVSPTIKSKKAPGIKIRGGSYPLKRTVAIR